MFRIKCVVFAWLSLPIVPLLSVEHNRHLNDQVERFSELMEIAENVRREYVDPVPVDELWIGALRGMLAHLDPHSQFLSAEEVTVYGSELPGRGFGFGFDWRIDPNTGVPRIVRVLPGSPAEKANLKPHQIIVAVNDAICSQLTLPELRQALHRNHDQLTLTLTQHDGEEFSVTLQRQELRDSGVGQRHMVHKEIGYLSLHRFRPGTGSEPSTTVVAFDQAIEQMRQQHMRALIIDCRGNAGGSIDAAVAIADRFIPGSENNPTVLVSVHSANNPARHAVKVATTPGTLPAWPLVVLVDKNTASSAEIFAAALKDHRRATIIGEKTYGKTTVQELFVLEQGDGMLLTVARFTTPQGADLSGTGLEPDIVMNPSTHEQQNSVHDDPQVIEATRILTALLQYVDYAEKHYPLKPLR